MDGHGGMAAVTVAVVAAASAAEDKADVEIVEGRVGCAVILVDAASLADSDEDEVEAVLPLTWSPMGWKVAG